MTDQERHDTERNELLDDLLTSAAVAVEDQEAPQQAAEAAELQPAAAVQPTATAEADVVLEPHEPATSSTLESEPADASTATPAVSSRGIYHVPEAASEDASIDTPSAQGRGIYTAPVMES